MLLRYTTFVVILFFADSLEDEYPSVTTSLGEIAGHYKTSHGGRTFAAFEGIRYGRAARFAEPQGVEPWEGVWDATSVTLCAQINQGVVSGEEECLYLNVYVPEDLLNSDSNLDTIVYIHGGAFIGGGTYLGGPGYLMDRDVVYVSVNYRLNMLGFLSTEDNVVSGNNGLKDQSLSLRWVQSHINAFGGNPNSVTVAGLSAGGGSVHFQYLSPQSEGLFHRAIAHSGTTLGPWAIQKAPLKQAQRLGEFVECNNLSTKELIECLRKIPLEELLQQHDKFYVFSEFPMTPFAPVVEKPSETAFLAEYPYKLLENGRINDVPMLMSVVESEGSIGIISLNNDLAELNEEWSQVLPYVLDYQYTVADSDKALVAEEIKQFYFDKENITNVDIPIFIRLFGDRHFFLDFERSSRMQEKVAISPTYSYKYAYKADLPYIGCPGFEGVCHGADGILAYEMFPATLSESDEKVKDTMVDLITSFAKSGKPEVAGVDFQPVANADNFTYLLIRGPNDIKMVSEKEIAPAEFWRSLPIKEYEKIDPFVTTSLGEIAGHYKTSHGGRTFAAFEGIRYGRAERFAEPQGVKPWEGVWDATSVTLCAQINQGVVSGEEECLYLNVYVPKALLNTDSNLDTIIYIHGGAFIGGGTYLGGPGYLMDRDVVYVSVNYRLNMLGFLSTGDDVVSGNNGLKDQSLALRWVQSHINAFGGNPNSVTVAGLSAGGGSVHFQYLSPQSEGLFHRAIAHSGTTVGPWAIQKAPLKQAQRLGEFVECNSLSTKELIECLRKIPLEELLQQHDKFYVFSGFPMTSFAPVVEKPSETAFLAEYPYKLLENGRINDVPMLMSAVESEGSIGIIYLNNDLAELNEQWSQVLPYVLDYQYTVADSDKALVAEKIKQFYFDKENITNDDIPTFIKLFGDRHFFLDFERCSRMQEKVATSPTYSYKYAYKADLPYIGCLGFEGVCHGADGILVYEMFPATLSESDEKVKDTMVDLITSFAKSGKPEVAGVDFQPVANADNFTYLLIRGPNDIKMVSEKEIAPAEFWRSLPIKEYEKIDPFVTTSLGEIAGHYKISHGGRAFAAFEGIQYGKAARFTEPQGVEPWEGVWDATSVTMCAQIIQGLVVGREECLYLNIYVPNDLLNTDSNLDTIVYIHGGGFIGGGTYLGGPGYLMDRDVIYVSVNYRLNMLGFLSTEDNVVSGNNGLKDQSLALKWVQSHIKAFGGNPNSVTVAGLSAGGASVHFQYLSPQSKGLFHRAIAHSGTTLAPWTIQKAPLKHAQRLGEFVECNRSSTKELIECLRQIPLGELLQQHKKFYGFSEFPITSFGPVVEKPSETAFLTEYPYKLLENGKINNVPILMSVVESEGSIGIISLNNDLVELNEKWSQVLPYVLDYQYTVADSDKALVAEEIMQFYFDKENITNDDIPTFIKLFGDRYFVLDFERCSRMQAKVAISPTYSYKYEYKADLPYIGCLGFEGVCHGADGILAYEMFPATLSESDEKMKDTMVDLITSFAKSGEPEVASVDFQPVANTDNFTYLLIRGPNDIKMISEKEIAPAEFWRSLPIKEYDKIDDNASSFSCSLKPNGLGLLFSEAFIFINLVVSAMVC